MNLITRVISIREGEERWAKNKNLKTEKAIRDVEVTPGMLTTLTARPASYLRHTYVFVGEKGQAVDVSNLRARVWELP